MGKKLSPISEKTQFTEAYHLTQSSVEAFSRLSPNVPKALLTVVQNIYGRFDEASHQIYLASNVFDKQEKVKALTVAQMELFFQFSSIELLVKSKGITIGAANEVLYLLKQAHEQTSKWLSSVKKDTALNT